MVDILELIEMIGCVIFVSHLTLVMNITIFVYVLYSVRLKLLPRDCFVRPSVHTFCELLFSSNKRVQVKVAKFAGVVFKKLNNV